MAYNFVTKVKLWIAVFVVNFCVMLPKILRMLDSKLYERTCGKMYLQRYLNKVEQQTEETPSS